MFVIVQLERLLQSPVTGHWHVVDFNHLFAHCAFSKPKSVHRSLDLYAECFCSLDGDFSFAIELVQWGGLSVGWSLVNGAHVDRSKKYRA